MPAEQERRQAVRNIERTQDLFQRFGIMKTFYMAFNKVSESVDIVAASRVSGVYLGVESYGRN